MLQARREKDFLDRLATYPSRGRRQNSPARSDFR